MAIAHAKKSEVTTSVDYEPANLRFIPMTTVSLTGTGSATVKATHMDNTEITLCSGLVTPAEPFTVFGYGYTKITIEKDSGTVYASFASSGI